MDNIREKLINLLNKDNYDYHIEGNTFCFFDKRVIDIFDYCLNRELANLLRQDKNISVLDLSHCPKGPNKINNFPYIREIIMPELTLLIPEIEDCNGLYSIEFDVSTIRYLKEKSFKGWPLDRKLKFGPSLKDIASFGFMGATDVIDLSECENLRISEHAFQYNNHIKKVILPHTITRLPDYLFFECKKLETVIATGCMNICWKTLKGCSNLKNCVFSSQFRLTNFEKCIGNETYSQNRTGIILGADDTFVYIFSFTDFKYYFAENDGRYKLDDIVTFNHDESINVDFKDGRILISSNYSDFHAIEIALEEDSEYNSVLSNRYLNKINDGSLYNHNENLQSSAIISIRKNIIPSISSDLRDVVNEIVFQVQNLNIDDIISSYHTDVNEWVKTKVGGDDTFYSDINTSILYTDPYIETLLPSIHSSYKESAYTSKWDYTDVDKIAKEDELNREKARAMYSQEKHIRFLLKHFIASLQEASTLVEKCLHISRAKDFIILNYGLYGKERVMKLNQEFTI